MTSPLAVGKTGGNPPSPLDAFAEQMSAPFRCRTTPGSGSRVASDAGFISARCKPPARRPRSRILALVGNRDPPSGDIGLTRLHRRK